MGGAPARGASSASPCGIVVGAGYIIEFDFIVQAVILGALSVQTERVSLAGEFIVNGALLAAGLASCSNESCADIVAFCVWCTVVTWLASVLGAA